MKDDLTQRELEYLTQDVLSYKLFEEMTPGRLRMHATNKQFAVLLEKDIQQRSLIRQTFFSGTSKSLLNKMETYNKKETGVISPPYFYYNTPNKSHFFEDLFGEAQDRVDAKDAPEVIEYKQEINIELTQLLKKVLEQKNAIKQTFCCSELKSLIHNMEKYITNGGVSSPPRFYYRKEDKLPFLKDTYNEAKAIVDGKRASLQIPFK